MSGFLISGVHFVCIKHCGSHCSCFGMPFHGWLAAVLPMMQVVCFFWRVRKMEKGYCWLCHVCPSAWNSSAPTGRIFMKFYVRGVPPSPLLKKLSRNFKSGWNLTRITGTLHEDVFTFMTISRWILLRMRNVLYKTRSKKMKTHLLCSVTFSRKSCCLWDNLEKCGGAGEATDGNIIRRKRFACFITKATHAHKYVIQSNL
jgi:hypothetical protein